MTSPTSGINGFFTQLDVQGNLNVSGTISASLGAGGSASTFLSNDGTAAAPGYTFTADTDTGIYRIGANDMGLAANGALVLEVDTTGISVTGSIGGVSTSATAFSVARSGTNYGFQVDESTASAATGLKVTAKAAASGVALAAISSGGNEALTLDAKGSGTVTIGSVSTGNIVIGGSGVTTTFNNSTGAVTVLAGGITVTAGGLTLTANDATITAGNLIFGAASANIIPGATSLLFRDTANANTNLSISNAGAVVIRAGLTITASGLTVTAGGATITAGNLTVSAGNVAVTGSVSATTSILSSGATQGIGYATGAGGTVTQSTNKSTGVTLNNVTGTITMNNASLNDATSVGFTLTNSAIAATDVVALSIKSGATANGYLYGVDAVAAGSCHITIRNVSGGALGEAVVLSFVVIKGVAA